MSRRLDALSVFVVLGVCLGCGAESGRRGAKDTVASSDLTPLDSAAEDVPGEPADVLEGDTDTAPAPDVTADEVNDDVAAAEDTTPVEEDVVTSKYTCEAPAPLPLEVVTLEGFTTSEDFAFDDKGRQVSTDENSNLVRITMDGTKTVFSPNIGSTAGTRFLPDGDLVVADAGNGTLVRVAKNGAQEVVLGGLEYPNGIEVDSQGFVYVAENNGGRVRRIDPTDGSFIIVGIGLDNPNGLSLSPDERTLFCGSFGGGVVYRIPLDDDSPEVTIFGRTPGGTASEPSWTCKGAVEGASCAPLWGGTGKCKPFGNVLDCFAVQPCDEKQAGDPCKSDFGNDGTCTESEGGLFCKEPSPCDGLAVGDPCTTSWSVAGTCQPFDLSLECVEKGPCDGLQGGDPCANFWGDAGVCKDFGGGQLYCEEPGPCDGVDPGGPCVGPSGLSGTCEPPEWDPNQLICKEIDPCEGFTINVPCTLGSGVVGSCQINEFDPDGPLTCQAPPPCDGKADGDPCTTPFNEPGVCHDDSFAEGLVCVPPGPCEGLSEGAECSELGSPGICTTNADGLPICVQVDPCTKLGAGAPCGLPWGYPGTCVADGDSFACRLNDPCDTLEAGAPCSDGIESSNCVQLETGLRCGTAGLLVVGACQGLSLASPCGFTVKGQTLAGVCTNVGSFAWSCEFPPDYAAPCKGKVAGEPCEILQSLGWYPGECAGVLLGALTCEPVGTSGGGGGLDGLNVDSCGFVYVTEYTVGWVWRFAPEGGTPELAAELPSSWIPNMHFGPGIGGFEKDVLYVSDRDQGRLFGLVVGLPGSPDAYPPAPEPTP